MVIILFSKYERQLNTKILIYYFTSYNLDQGTNLFQYAFDSI